MASKFHLHTIKCQDSSVFKPVMEVSRGKRLMTHMEKKEEKQHLMKRLLALNAMFQLQYYPVKKTHTHKTPKNL